MGSSNTPNRPGAIIEGINVTPLVDIMLVLLVIFIVTAKILVIPVVPMELPKATRTDEVQTVFSVAVPAQGPVRVNGQPLIDEKALEARARVAIGEDRELRAVIAADGAVPHSRVISTMDALRRAGVTKVAFATQPAPEPGR